MQNKFSGILGLAMRAGKVRSGEFASAKSLKSGKSKLILVSEDASENTKKKFRDQCRHRGVPIYEVGTKRELGHWIGREERSSVSIEDAGFSEQMKRILDGGESEWQRKATKI